MITYEDMTDMGYYEEPPKAYPSVADMAGYYYKTAEINPKPDLSASLMVEEFNEWWDEWEYGTLPEEELKELADLTYVIFGYAQSRGWNLMEAICRVHSNNLARMKQDDGTIKRREDGKVLKNPSTPAVDLEDLV